MPNSELRSRVLKSPQTFLFRCEGLNDRQRLLACSAFRRHSSHLLKGPEAEDHTLYASHTVWKNRATFEAWTKSEAFRAAHASAGGNKPLYLGHPQFEGFETIQTVRGR